MGAGFILTTYIVRYNLIPSFELQQWYKFLEISWDEYIWLPYSCCLQPMNLDDDCYIALFQNCKIDVNDAFTFLPRRQIYN